jgi:hypothetical protein
MEVATAAHADEPDAEPSTDSSGSHTSEEACAEPGCLDRVGQRFSHWFVSGARTPDSHFPTTFPDNNSQSKQH